MTQPNIILIITDQQRYDTISALGFPYMDTPNLDRLVDEGVSFDNCHVTAPFWAHRTVNVADEDFVFFSVWEARAGHDYGTIERDGFRKLVVLRDGGPAMVDNPKYG